MLELRYNELFTTSQYRQKELQDKITQISDDVERIQDQKNSDISEMKARFLREKSTLKNRIARLETLKERGKDKVREFLLQTAGTYHQNQVDKSQIYGQHQLAKKNLHSQIEKNQKREEELKQKIYQLSEMSKTHIRQLEKRLRDRDKNIDVLQEKLRNAEGLFKDQLAQEIRAEKETQRTLELQCVDLNNKIDHQSQSRQQIESLTSEVSTLQNQKVVMNRKTIDDRELYNIELSKIKNENKNLRADVHNLSNQLHESEKTVAVTESKIIDLSRDNQKIEKDLKSIRELWLEMQTRLEKKLSESSPSIKLIKGFRKSSVSRL